MNRIFFILIALLASFALQAECCGSCGAGNKMITIGHLTISDAYFIANKGASNAAAYLTIKNADNKDDQLLSVSFFGAMIPKVELHTHVIDENGVARMRKIDAMLINQQSEKSLKPGADHIMLMNVTDKLADVQSIDLTLTFKKAGRVTIPFKKKDLKVSCCGDNS
jgi:copper(I)-binding protein